MSVQPLRILMQREPASVSPCYNYCLWPYEPLHALIPQSQAPLALLLHSFEIAGVATIGRSIVESLLLILGPAKTVFGIKSIHGQPCWEFYFYDYECRNRSLPTARVLEFFAEVFGCRIELAEDIPYFMFSVELTLQQLLSRQAFEGVTLYLGNPGGTLFGGKSYLITPQNPELVFQNVYHFYNPAADQADMLQHVQSSYHLAQLVEVSASPLHRSYANCETTCFAHKRSADGIYFAGIPIGYLIDFLSDFKQLGYMLEYLLSHASQFDHLLFDVGFDCALVGGNLIFPKVSLYGFF